MARQGGHTIARDDQPEIDEVELPGAGTRPERAGSTDRARWRELVLEHGALDDQNTRTRAGRATPGPDTRLTMTLYGQG